MSRKNSLKILQIKSISVRTASVATLVLGGLLASTGPAVAGFELYTDQSTTTVIDGFSKLYRGAYERNANNTQAIPFTIQVFSSGNECLRLSVVSQASDLETVLIGPEGTTWRDDDGGGSFLPLIQANTPIQGWYTVHISSFNGSGAASLFTLRYGRYNSGNPNCATPTPPA